ncbi:Putative F-box domain-containing protein [Septoria linicola]|uniref:F-box domain-containing protein n=1 Tax=Septoria linicola TaxID=215465 RepID=A0A9Q9APJ9_9PEZI|nr:putative F-box domain-containing protein [Septoria linicola]USW50783.1 Putative F-box domain-containing protein [Septoria linicola]
MSSLTLTDLPAELFERIGEFLPLQVLRNIRLVNREANSKTLRLSLESASLNIREAAKVIDHEVFSSAIGQVNLCIDTIISEDTATSDETRTGIYEMAVDWQEDESIPWPANQGIQQERDHMSATGEDRELFTQIRNKLKVIGKLQTLHITDTLTSWGDYSSTSCVPIAYDFNYCTDAFCFSAIDAPKPVGLACALETLFEVDVTCLSTFSMKPTSWAFSVSRGCCSNSTLDAQLFSKLQHVTLVLHSEGQVANEISTFLNHILAQQYENTRTHARLARQTLLNVLDFINTRKGAYFPFLLLLALLPGKRPKAL